MGHKSRTKKVAKKVVPIKRKQKSWTDVVEELEQYNQPVPSDRVRARTMLNNAGRVLYVGTLTLLSIAVVFSSTAHWLRF
jgi:hypothetical protein